MVVLGPRDLGPQDGLVQVELAVEFLHDGWLGGQVDDVGPSLRNASAKVNRISRSGGDGGYSGGQRSQSGSGGGRPGAGSGQGQGGYGGGDPDPWATDSPGGYSDEPPF